MMNNNPLRSLSTYSRFVAKLLNRISVKHSTVMVWSDSPYTGIAEGDVFFTKGIRLRFRKELDFEARLITAFGYCDKKGGPTPVYLYYVFVVCFNAI